MIKKLAVIVTRGSYNNLLQAIDVIGVAAEAGAQVTVLFRDEAAAKMTQSKASEMNLSEGFRGRESRVREWLKQRGLHSLPSGLSDVKAKGDIKLSVSRESLEWFDITVEQLIAELDEVQGLASFWKETVIDADQVLTF